MRQMTPRTVRSGLSAPEKPPAVSVLDEASLLMICSLSECVG